MVRTANETAGLRRTTAAYKENLIRIGGARVFLDESGYQRFCFGMPSEQPCHGPYLRIQNVWDRIESPGLDYIIFPVALGSSILLRCSE